MAIYNGNRRPWRPERDDDPIYDFAKKYNVRGVEVEHYPNYSNYNSDFDAIATVSLPLTSLRDAARFDKAAHRILSDHYDEEKLRRQYTGVQEAWDKYQLMLTLVKG